MVQLVAQPTALWDKFLRLLTGDYHVPKINKEGKTHLVKGPPIKTISFLFNLFGFDTQRTISMLDSIINGEATLESVSKNCKMVKGFLRCRTYIVQQFKAIGAKDPDTNEAPTWEFLKQNTEVVKSLQVLNLNLNLNSIFF